ncbi:ROK family transcriptional regulator [Pseudonocardia acidicola]|uniref:ROK family transcriptional regulator n=1 Tax=Pseudonocardia acidicola TaxID=2724939 RepID=A0ABX1SMC9_9PSEU|nr:ROK family transcriptional regulator [Pseudonocardia acidicola]NMI01713.1 ROK family transcriptional regulator [Pseudonocardia acidicola]
MQDRPRRVRPGSPTSLKKANQALLVRALQVAGALTQAEIARVTGLAPSTVSNIVRELSARDLITVSRAEQHGRAVQAVRLSRSAGLVVGIDFGHRHLRVALADLAYEVLAEERVPLDDGHKVTDGLSEAGRIIDALLAEAETDRTHVIGIGMGLPAPIDLRTGQVGAPSILPGWVGVDAATVASERLGAAVRVDNDANLGALAEARWGAGRGAESLAYLKLSDGVGAGLLIGGQLYRGRSGTAGEIGHVTMNDFGPVCRCGNRGCLETLVSTGAVLDLLEPGHGPGLTIVGVVALARDGDVSCRRVLADTGHHVGIAVANLCNVVNPDRIVIGGELAQAGDLLLDSMWHTLNRYGIPSAVQTVDIVLAELGARSQLLGALALGLQGADPVIAALVRTAP